VAEYLVHLAVRVEADSPSAAPVALIGHLVENGLTDWAYQVTEPETEESFGIFDGYGLEVDVAGREGSSPEQTPVQTDQPVNVEQDASDETAASDAALLTLATELNEADQPADQPVEPTVDEKG
jgi:hypothetical protein